MVRLSVIIPGYNTACCLWRRCVASVLRALGPDDEIVVVDDGSDEPVRFPDEWGVKIVRRENGGLGAARNSGLAVAKGEWVTFVDSDDEIRPETFDRCLAQLQTTGADVAIYGVTTVWVEERLRKDDVMDKAFYGALDPRSLQQLIRGQLFNYSCNKVYRHSFLRQHGLQFDPVGMPCEDVIFNLEWVMAGARWCMVDYAGYVYYRTGLTLLSRYKPSNYRGLHHCSAAWSRYKEMTPAARDVFGLFGEVDEMSIARLEKRNRLKPGSPYWLSTWYNLARRLFYVRPVRRWHLKRQFPKAVSL